MSEYEPKDSMYWEHKFRELRSKTKNWHDRLEKGLSHSSIHLFKELIDVYKEMEKELK